MENQEFTTPVPEPVQEDIALWKKGIRRQANKTGIILLAFFLLVNLLVVAASLLMRQFVYGRIEDTLYNSLINLLSFALQYLVVVPPLLWVNNRKTDHRIPKLLTRPQASGKFLAKWTVIGFGCAYAVNYLFSLLFLILQFGFGVELHAPSLTSGGTLLDDIVTVFFFAIAAPTMEEALFRGGVLGNFRKYGDWFAIGMSALLFGLLHMNYQQIFYAAAIGLIAGYVCVKAESLWPAILIHFSLNGVGAIQSVVLGRLDLAGLSAMDSGNMEEMLAFLLSNGILLLLFFFLSMLCFAASIVGVVLLCIEIVRNRREMKLQNPCPFLSTRQKLFAALTAPALLLFLLLTLVMTVVNAMGIV